jgi:hypothetical protein
MKLKLSAIFPLINAHTALGKGDEVATKTIWNAAKNLVLLKREWETFQETRKQVILKISGGKYSDNPPEPATPAEKATVTEELRLANLAINDMLATETEIENLLRFDAKLLKIGKNKLAPEDLATLMPLIDGEPE